jgi:biopolymer transport protein ExbB
MEEAWNLLRQGGPVMVPLALCSIAALALVLDRFWALRRKRVLPGELLSAARRFRAADDPGAVLAPCDARPGPLATVLSVVVEDPPRTRELAVERVQTAGRRAVRELERGLVALEIIAVISPLLGLLGTVLGMFHTFQVIAEQGLGDPGALSGGISQALITTIFGLGIAIPTAVAQSYFSHRVDDLVLEIEEHGGALVDHLYPDGVRLAAELRRGPAPSLAEAPPRGADAEGGAASETDTDKPAAAAAGS